jgi:SAM-dependent methyltransferase
MADDVTRALRDAYDRRADERDTRPTPAWEAAARDDFVAQLGREGRTRLLELGAATGTDAAAFAARGLDVVCVDLSPEMVARCRAKGLEAHVMDVADLRFPDASFDAVYAMNCLVHVPKAAWPAALSAIRRVLRPEGLFYLGLYGGRDFEGVWDGDHYEPPRFFAHFRDDDLRRLVRGWFVPHSWRRVARGWNGLHFQSLVLRRPPSPRGAGGFFPH